MKRMFDDLQNTIHYLGKGGDLPTAQWLVVAGRYAYRCFPILPSSAPAIGEGQQEFAQSSIRVSSLDRTDPGGHVDDNSDGEHECE